MKQLNDLPGANCTRRRGANEVLGQVLSGVVEQKVPIERTVASKEVSTAQEDSAHGQSSR